MTKYRNCIIELAFYGGYEWYHPEYQDASWDGDGWHTSWCGSAETIEGCKDWIDMEYEYYKEHQSSSK